MRRSATYWLFHRRAGVENIQERVFWQRMPKLEPRWQRKFAELQSLLLGGARLQCFQLRQQFDTLRSARMWAAHCSSNQRRVWDLWRLLDWRWEQLSIVGNGPKKESDKREELQEIRNKENSTKKQTFACLHGNFFGPRYTWGPIYGSDCL